MTGVPEVVLAVEAGLRYAAISLVVNPAAGVGAGDPITMDEINAVLAASSRRRSSRSSTTRAHPRDLRQLSPAAYAMPESSASRTSPTW